MQLPFRLNPKLITHLSASSRDDALLELVELLHREGKIQNTQEFYNAVLTREKIVTTGIGMGVAIPHAKLPSLTSFFIAIGVLEKGVDWHALDDAPVRLIFLIGGPDDKQTEYLQILSGITSRIKDEERRKKIFTSATVKDILQIFETQE